MKRKVICVLSICLFIWIVISNAYADFQDLYPVGSSGSETQKDIFGWDEQPWLYLHLPSSAKTYTVSWWNLEGTTTFYDTLTITTGSDKAWHTLDNWFDPGGPRQLGYWTINADYSSSAGSGSGTANFTVTPEPISSVLFLIGGAALVTRHCRKRRQKA